VTENFISASQSRAFSSEDSAVPLISTPAYSAPTYSKSVIVLYISVRIQ